MQNSTTSNITMSHTKQHREETFPFDGGLGVAAGVGGIIPAHAGLTGVSSPSWSNLRDHPHACGAHFVFIFTSPVPSGSSPRMRGSPLSVMSIHSSMGIIPAYAGLTPGITRLSSRARDHPRVCEAHSARPVNMRMYPGSSPRIRGSPMFTLHYYLTKWIIPAYAGLTPRSKTESAN